jgi:hypothetical protein
MNWLTAIQALPGPWKNWLEYLTDRRAMNTLQQHGCGEYKTQRSHLVLPTKNESQFKPTLASPPTSQIQIDTESENHDQAS